MQNSIRAQKIITNKTELIKESHDSIDVEEFKTEKFNIIPADFSYDIAYLIDNVKPEVRYAYWECLTFDSSINKARGDIIVYNGDSLQFAMLTKKINCSKGFFNMGHLVNSYSYIIGVWPNKTIDLIDSNVKLKQFIGHIDNIEEAILISKINGYSVDSDSIIGGAYRERENDYLLYLLDYSSTPVTYKSVRAILTKNGDFKAINKTTYKQIDEFIIE